MLALDGQDQKRAAYHKDRAARGQVDGNLLSAATTFSPCMMFVPDVWELALLFVNSRKSTVCMTPRVSLARTALARATAATINEGIQ